MPKLNRKKLLISLACLLLSILVFGLTTSLPIIKDTLILKVKAQSVPAFHGAGGAGAVAVGGRGGRVLEVTNLNDSGSGSLRACVEASGPRTCVFRTSGTIDVTRGFIINNPYITIAGQTAPGGGILIKGKNATDDPMIQVATHDVIIRYLRIRVGKTDYPKLGSNIIIFGGANIYNIIFDHISTSWSGYGFAVWANYGGASDITFQYGILSEALAGHSINILTGGQTSALAKQIGNLDTHHTLFMNTSHRQPLVKTPTFRLVNNIIYNWGFYATQTVGGVSSDIIGNLYKKGPLSPGNHEVQAASASGTDAADGDPSIYIVGNKGPHNSNPTANNWPMVVRVSGENGSETSSLSESYRRSSPMATQAFPITADSVLDLEINLLPDVGASHRLDQNGNWIANRDAVDTRLIQEYRDGKGIIPSDESEVGGFPNIASGTPYADSDHDGMPNDWENKYGFNPYSSSDGLQDTDGDGYTNLEEFLNGTNPTGGTPLPTATPGSPTPTPTPSPTPNPYDLTHDGKVNAADLLILLQNWGSTSFSQGDFNSDGKVNSLDFGMLIANWTE